MSKRKNYRKMAIRMKTRCKEYGCRDCEFDFDLKKGWGRCDYVFFDNGEQVPRNLTINQISKSLKGLTIEKALKELD